LKDWGLTLQTLKSTWDSLSPEQRLEALARVQEVEQARVSCPLRFWTPNGAQEKAIREIGRMENFAVLLSFANGVGKTSSVFAILAAIMWGAPTSAFDWPLYTDYPAKWPKIIRIVTEPALLNDGGPIQVESDKWWPKGRYQWSKGGKTFNRYLYTDTGFFAEVMSYEQAVKEFEGKTVGINVFIEPPPEPIFNACIARQRMGGINILDMTPLMGAAWVLDKLVSKPVMLVDGNEVGRVSTITASIEENCVIHGRNGQLEHSNIVNIVSRYDPDERSARAFGKFMALSGRIYKGFNREAHVQVKPLPQTYTLYHIVDPAIAKPLAMAWGWVDRAGSLHIFREWPEFEFQGARDSNLDVPGYASLIRGLESGRAADVRILDRHFGNARRTVGGMSLRQEFAVAGLDFQDSYTLAPDVEVETGILKVKEALKYDTKKPIDALNFPRLTIDPSCRNTIAALEKWMRKPETGKPLEEYKDFNDLIRYFVMANPRVEEPSSWVPSSGAYWGVNS
jgi:phage terminase large subunit-like protein